MDDDTREPERNPLDGTDSEASEKDQNVTKKRAPPSMRTTPYGGNATGSVSSLKLLL